MPDPPEEKSPPQPLVFRSYRRHRKQSRWGTVSLFVPPAALLWATFWYLMSSRRRPADAQVTGINDEIIILIAGCAVISLAGVALAAAGMLDSNHKHNRAVIGLAINTVILVGMGVLFFLRLFAQSVA